MGTAPLPPDEAERLASLHQLGVVYTPAEERYDRITRLAARLFGAPIALVSLVDERTQWFKSAHGLDAPETPREQAFCSHAILEEETFVVEDATKDPRFLDNPLVTGAPDIRFYAGHPIHAGDGQPVGTLCIIDRKPRSFAEADRAALRDLAALVEAELQREQLDDSQRKWVLERADLVRKASIDTLTRAWNRGAIMGLLDAEIARAGRGTPLNVGMIDIDRFKDVNDTYGHPAGDAVLTEVAARVRGAVRDFDLVGRYGGEEFIVLLGDCQNAEGLLVCERIRSAVAAQSVAYGNRADVSVTVSIGVAGYGPERLTCDALIDAADRALYRAKNTGRNVVVSD